MAHDALTVVQAPPMTAAHVETMRAVESLWGYPNHADLRRITEVRQHLEALVQAPAAAAMAAPSYGGLAFDDWRLEYKPPTVEDCYDCDQ